MGVDDMTIQRILRHGSVEVTRRAYIKTLPKQAVDAMDRFDESIGELGIRTVTFVHQVFTK